LRSIVVLALAVALSACNRAPSRQALSEADRAAIRALDSTFVAGWLKDDTAAVLRLFAPDAVLLPPGAAPVNGLTAIRGYWWPADGSHTRITGFSRAITEVGGTRSLAFLRGTATLSWTYEKSGKTSTSSSRSQDLFFLEPDSTGGWHVISQMWSTLP